MADKTKKPRLTWKRQANETGGGGVGQPERGYATVAVVRPRPGGYYWFAFAPARRISGRSTETEKPHATIDAAKAEAEAYVREFLDKQTATK